MRKDSEPATLKNAATKVTAPRSGYAANNTSLYRPLQPAVTENDDYVCYREFAPHPALQHYIYCYWELRTFQPLERPFSYRVVADGCIDIAFNMSCPEESIVMGFHNMFNEFPLDSQFNYVGIRFSPAMFPLVFAIDALDLSNRVHPLDDVLPRTAGFIRDHLNPAYYINRVVQVFDEYFTKYISRKNQDLDNRFFKALQHILINRGLLNIESDLDTGLSSRQMRRLFNFYIGDSPKSFARVVRFQSVLQAKPSLRSLRENKLFFDAGYYDQAHFIKEFRNFYGVTPSKAFAGYEHISERVHAVFSDDLSVIQRKLPH